MDLAGGPCLCTTPGEVHLFSNTQLVDVSWWQEENLSKSSEHAKELVCVRNSTCKCAYSKFCELRCRSEYSASMSPDKKMYIPPSSETIQTKPFPIRGKLSSKVSSKFIIYVQETEKAMFLRDNTTSSLGSLSSLGSSLHVNSATINTLK